MKAKLLSTLAAAALCAPAWAQSNVTIYGLADLSVARVSNVAGGQRISMESGYLQSSRIGFRGTEDLGGGLSALFTLESGVNVNSGASTSSVFFNRQAFVGLSDSSMGRLTLGRQYTLVYDLLNPISGAPAFGVAGGAVDGIPSAGSSAGRFDNTIGGTRVDNSVKYNSPRVGGWRVDAMYGFGGVVNSTAANSFKSVAAGYESSALQFSTSYHSRDCADATGCTPSHARDEVFAVGGRYDFGTFRLASIFSNEKNAKNVAGNNADVYHFLVQVPSGPWLYSAGVQHQNDKTALNQDVNQYNLSVLYFLSKSTTLYGSFSQQKVSNGGKAGMVLVTSSDNKQSAMALGLRHVF